MSHMKSHKSCIPSRLLLGAKIVAHVNMKNFFVNSSLIGMNPAEIPNIVCYISGLL